MLLGLCGNKNVEKILLFLFVNNKCYGTQLQRLLKTPLTSLQNALSRLEKGGIVLGYCEGKTKIFQFNPAYPLLGELELLLKKRYMLLSPEEKKPYSFVKEEGSIREMDPWKKSAALLNFWERLASVKHLTLQAKSKSKEDGSWNGKGKGEVIVTKEGGTVLIFNERGLWDAKAGQEEISFSNTYRWKLDKSAGLISLEHLRFGFNHPVFLFYLTPTGDNLLSSVESHLCEDDAYLSQIFWDRRSVRLMWRVIGPKKNQEMECHYV